MYPISVINPMDRAWNGMVARLFKPFQLGKWFALGFSAWLAMMISGVGFPTFTMPNSNDYHALKEPISEFWLTYSYMIIPAIGIAIVIILLFSLVILWISARGTFMFLRNVVDDQTEIGAHWRTFRNIGNSLCLWMIGYSIIATIIIIFLVIGFVLALWPMLSHGTAGTPGSPTSMIATVVAGMLLLFTLGMVMMVIHMFLIDFVAPLMMKHGIRTNEAWVLLISIVKKHPGTFVLYALFRIALNIGSAFLIGIMIVMTCCCFLFLLAIPYINAVVTLPILVFFRLYSIEFLRAFGDDFDVFAKGSLDDVLPLDDAPEIPSPS